MCDHQWSVYIESESGQANESLVNSSNKDVFVVHLVLYYHEQSVLHAWECDAITRNVVKGLADQNRVDCLFAMIGQSDMLSLYGTEDTMCLGHRGLPGKKKTRRRSLYAIVPKVCGVFCQASWHNLRELSALHN